jgi:mannose/fructose/N-acetylgalactosamine-specific phosphotransferase system component IIC
VGSSASQIALVSIVGSFIRLDRYSIGQLMFSRPLVAGTVVGFCLGEAREGMFIGALLELLWIHSLPVGDALPGDESLATIVITAVSCLAAAKNITADRELIIVSLLLFLPVAPLGRRLDNAIRSWNDQRIQLARRAAEQGNLPPLGLIVVRAVIRDFLLVVLFLAAIISLGTVAVPFLYAITPVAIRAGFRVLYFLLPVFGVASLLTTARSKGAISLFCAAFLLTMVVVETLIR